MGQFIDTASSRLSVRADDEGRRIKSRGQRLATGVEGRIPLLDGRIRNHITDLAACEGAHETTIVGKGRDCAFPQHVATAHAVEQDSIVVARWPVNLGPVNVVGKQHRLLPHLHGVVVGADGAEIDRHANRNVVARPS